MNRFVGKGYDFFFNNLAAADFLLQVFLSEATAIGLAVQLLLFQLRQPISASAADFYFVFYQQQIKISVFFFSCLRSSFARPLGELENAIAARRSAVAEIDWVSVIKSQPHLIDVSYQDDAFKENMDIPEGSTIDVMIEYVGPLIHESRSLEELDIAVETYFEKEQNDETEIEWDSNEDSDEDSDKETDEYSDTASSNDYDEDSDR
ncbi:hypothetical protein M9H77_23722 [Catharanthus roseus]|uniref:Uncharacterized protein n=1 Tax=Catharanthus roseus TaxID=4058 RepID=A0ACC0AV32_CATRO|nr:hypothetical protein M9H77_23722 [Catharanthus roseus]